VTLLDIKGTKNKSENIEDHIEYLKKIIWYPRWYKKWFWKILEIHPPFFKTNISISPIVKTIHLW
jgi:hypothetical protein